jgi:hypothetical protein
MPMGSKVKVVAAIAQEMNVKLDQKAIHGVMALRNAFAHHPLDSHPVLIVGKTPAEDESHFQLQILSNSGKLSRKRRKDALDEFNSSYKLAKASLVRLRDTVKASRSTSAA